MHAPLRAPSLTAVYLLVCFYTLHVAVPAYINSSFLELLTNQKTVGLVFAGASLVSIVALAWSPRILKSMGDFSTTLIFLTAEVAIFFGLATLKDPVLLIALFIISYALIYLISLDLDLIVESFSKDAATGSTRGLYLTSANIAWVLAPILAAGILRNGDYWRVYMAAAFLLIPALVIFARRLEHFRDPRYRSTPLFETARAVWQSKDLRNIFAASLILNFFFTWMVIYTPVYLHEQLSFPWEDIGIMFSIMLVPFLLLEAPLGRIADRYLGEKELLTLGFVIIAVATMLMSFVTDNAFLTWTALLFATRVGAACVEIMSETYFFKKIDGRDANIISFQRTVRPLAGIIGPLTASALLLFIPFQYLFLALGLITLLGVPFSLGIKDTR